MRKDWGKRIFIAALLLVFAALILAFARESVESEMRFESMYPRINNGIALEVDEAGILHFKGAGKLFRQDIQALVKANRVESKAMTDVVVEDGIDEIGYKAFSAWQNLQTLKLGNDVRQVDVAGVSNCVSLQYVWLPASLQATGKDFLADCNDCTVISGNSADRLPEMANVDDSHIIADIQSYGMLEERCGSEVELPSALKLWWQ